MTRTHQQLARDFLREISGGNLPDDLVAPDMTFWSVNSGQSEKERFHAGVKALAAIFDGTLTYHVDMLTTEEDRVVAEVRSEGTLTNGEPFQNDHVFLFRIRDGRIAFVGEYMNQFVVRDKIAPLMQSLMNKAKDQ